MMLNKRQLPLALAAIICATPFAAQAQSNVTIFGLIDMSVGRSQAPGGVAQTGVDSGKMSTSNFGFKGSEDLGGGLKADFSLEGFLRADVGAGGRFNGDSMWSRNSWVGLNGDLGAVNVGRITTSLFVNTLIFNAFGDSYGYSPSIRHYFTSGTVTGDSGWSDSIKYTSPKFGGASFTAHVAAGEGDGGSNVGVSGLYFGGPLALGLAWQRVDKGAAVADTTTWQLGGSYDLKVAKLFGQYGKVDNKTTRQGYKISSLGAAIPVGAGKVLLQAGHISPDTAAARSTFSLGYDYSLSKRTDAYVTYMSDKIDGLSRGSNFSVGIRHRF